MKPVAVLQVARLFGTPVAETILASAHARAHRQAGHMDASDLIKALQNILRGGGRSLIASPLSTAFTNFDWCRQTGVTVLSAVGVCRRNIWSEAQALQCPQRAHVEPRGPTASLAACLYPRPGGQLTPVPADCTGELRQSLVRLLLTALTNGTVGPNAKCCAGSPTTSSPVQHAPCRCQTAARSPAPSPSTARPA